MDLTMKRNRKWLALIMILILTGVFFTAGWGKKRVDLLEANLLDLDKAIESSLLGVDASDASDSDSDSEKTKDTVSDDSSGKKVKPKDRETSVTRMTIEIHGKEINYDGKTWASADELLEELKKKAVGRITVYLRDNYAEAHVYHSVDEALSSFCKERGYEYTAD